jgi:hypothetical protein
MVKNKDMNMLKVNDSIVWDTFVCMKPIRKKGRIIDSTTNSRGYIISYLIELEDKTIWWADAIDVKQDPKKGG